MGDFYNTNTSQDTSYNNSDIYSYGYHSNDTDYYDYNNSDNNEEYSLGYIPRFTAYVVKCIIICIGLPLTLVAIHGVYSLVRNDHVAPIYVINLLISDLIQFCCMIVQVAAKPENWIIRKIFLFLYYFGLMASVGFMVCVALERYLVIARPLWYRFRRTIKISIAVCVVVWALPLVFLLPLYFDVHLNILTVIFAVFFLLPLPLFIFSWLGPLKLYQPAVSPLMKNDGLWQFWLWCYLLTFFYSCPALFGALKKKARYSFTFHYLTFTFIKLSPLADLFLYIFLRKGAVDKMLSSLCCCKMESNDISRSTMTE